MLLLASRRLTTAARTQAFPAPRFCSNVANNKLQEVVVELSAMARPLPNFPDNSKSAAHIDQLIRLDSTSAQLLSAPTLDISKNGLLVLSLFHFRASIPPPMNRLSQLEGVIFPKLQDCVKQFELRDITLCASAIPQNRSDYSSHLPSQKLIDALIQQLITLKDQPEILSAPSPFFETLNSLTSLCAPQQISALDQASLLNTLFTLAPKVTTTPEAVHWLTHARKNGAFDSGLQYKDSATRTAYDAIIKVASEAQPSLMTPQEQKDLIAELNAIKSEYAELIQRRQNEFAKWIGNVTTLELKLSDPERYEKERKWKRFAYIVFGIFIFIAAMGEAGIMVVGAKHYFKSEEEPKKVLENTE